MTYAELLDKIKNNIPFAFSRFGDGELQCVLHPSEENGNCDSHKYFFTLSEALKKILLSKPKYHLGLQGHAMRTNGDEIRAFFKENDIDENSFCDSDILHRASINNELGKLFEVLKGKEIVFVAPEYLWYLFPNSNHVIVPVTNCWLSYKRIMDECVWSIDVKERQVFLFCAGMASNVFIDELYNLFPQHTYIDCGSVLDVYAGKCTRSYHKKILERIQNEKI